MNTQSKTYFKVYVYIYILTSCAVFLEKSVLIIDIAKSEVSISNTITAVELVDALLFAVGPSIVLIKVFNKYVWKCFIVKKILGIDIPYIEGRWEGWIKSTYSNYQQKHEVVIEFTQTLTKISVWYYDKNAVMHSLVSTSILDELGGTPRLLFIYDNNPIISNNSGLHRHIGVMELYIMGNEDVIKGTYFNNPTQIKTYGEIELNFISRKKLKKFNK